MTSLQEPNAPVTNTLARELSHRLGLARFTKYPQGLTMHDYATASAEIDAALIQLPQLVALYKTGGLGAPGISDIDRVAVVDSSTRVPPIWPKLSDHTRYIAMHPPMVIDVDLFRLHRWFAHLEPLSIVYGTQLKVNDKPDEDIGTLLAAEGLIVNMLRLMRQAVTAEVKVRATLCELNTVRYGLALARLSRADNPLAWRFADDISALRSQWFDMYTSDHDKKAELLSLLQRAPTVLYSAIQSLLSPTRTSTLHTNSRSDLTLAAPWSNIRLVPDMADTSRYDVGLPSLPLFNYARSLGRFWWRVRRMRLPVPPPVFSLLTGCTSDNALATHWRERQQLLRRYRAFLTYTGAGYSPVTLALPFLVDDGACFSA